MAEKKNEPKIKQEQTVPYRLERSTVNSGPQFAAVNGRNYMIKRGVTVQIPESVREVLDESIRAENIALDYDESAADKN